MPNKEVVNDELLAYSNTKSTWHTDKTPGRERLAYRDGHFAGWSNAADHFFGLDNPEVRKWKINYGEARVAHAEDQVRMDGMKQENRDLRGENNVLRALLVDADDVLKTIDPESDAESDEMSALRERIDKALT